MKKSARFRRKVVFSLFCKHSVRANRLSLHRANNDYAWLGERQAVQLCSATFCLCVIRIQPVEQHARLWRFEDRHPYPTVAYHPACLYRSFHVGLHAIWPVQATYRSPATWTSNRHPPVRLPDVCGRESSRVTAKTPFFLSFFKPERFVFMPRTVFSGHVETTSVRA